MYDATTRSSMFTVVLPTLGTRIRSLERAVRSVLDQEWRDFELLIVVNAGPIVPRHRSLGESDARIRILSEPRPGVAWARNLAVEHAAGAWLAFLDDDDRWYPRKLLGQARLLSELPDVA